MEKKYRTWNRYCLKIQWDYFKTKLASLFETKKSWQGQNLHPYLEKTEGKKNC